MMGHEEKLKSGDAADAFSHRSRRLKNWKPGIIRRIKKAPAQAGAEGSKTVMNLWLKSLVVVAAIHFVNPEWAIAGTSTFKPTLGTGAKLYAEPDFEGFFPKDYVSDWKPHVSSDVWWSDPLLMELWLFHHDAYIGLPREDKPSPRHHVCNDGTARHIGLLILCNRN